MLSPVGDVAVVVPLTPSKLAVIVTDPPVPTSVAFPALLPEAITATAQVFELLHVADFVTSLVVLSLYAASAVKVCVWLDVSAAVLGLIVIEVGALTKNPLHPGLTINANTANNAAIRVSLRFELGMILITSQSLAEAAFQNCSRGIPRKMESLYQRVTQGPTLASVYTRMLGFQGLAKKMYGFGGWAKEGRFEQAAVEI